MTASILTPRLALAAIWLALTLPVTVQAQAGDPFSFDIPDVDLAEFLTQRPPMGECPAGESSHPDAIPKRAHLFHLGVRNFFLDHASHLKLTTEQKESLRTLRDDTWARWKDAEQGIQSLEVELWALTGAETPRLPEIETMIRTIAERRAAQRSAYVAAVARAAQVLTPDQRRQLRDGANRGGR